jgi:hypothetical protein
MSKKPLVPVKRPTKGSGKGNHRGLKKLMKEVDSMAKGLNEVNGMKGLKGGVGWLSRGTNKDVKEVVAKDYYDKLRDFFENPENIANIKRLKEGLVNDVLGTMAGWFNSILNNNKMPDDSKVAEIVNFVSIISDIDNLKQGRLDEVISSGNLKDLPYIDKISSLVMIRMLIDVNNSQNKKIKIKDENNFRFLDNTKVLISKIIAEYSSNSGKDVATLNSLIEEIKSEFKYYTEIYRLRDYEYIKGKGDDTDVEKIIEELKEKCNEVKEENDFKKFITSSNINPTDFTTGCDDISLKKQIGKVNEIIKKMKGQYEKLTGATDVLKDNQLYIQLFENRDPSKLLKQRLPNQLGDVLYDLYNSITTYEKIMEEFKNMKEEYIECVKPFFDGTLLNKYMPKDELTPIKKSALKEGSITDKEITDLEEEITRIRETRIAIENLGGNNTGKSYNNIPFNMKEIIDLFNKLCNANTTYNQYMTANNTKEEEFKAAAAEKEKGIKEGVRNSLQSMIGNAAKKASEPDEIKTVHEKNKESVVAPTVAPTPIINLPNIFEEGNREELGGGKLTTKYISTGNFVYILYEKKKIKRCVYTKAKGRGKYCKIKGDYMLLSKLKVV